MDRELFIEIGTEEIPASWLPPLTTAIGVQVETALAAHRLAPDAAIETYSTPRRLVVRVEKVADRQSDHEEVVTGPPVSAAFRPDGAPTPAATGFAKKHGVEVEALERLETPKGVYLAHRLQHRGKAAVDVLPDVLHAVLRGLSFPKQMRWDAMLEDGRGELPFGRPIRWVIFLYGGRVVPFTIFRTPLAQGPLVQEVRSAAVTYGHRFFTTSGRAGRAIKVKGFDDYRKRLAENFVVLERHERHDRIVRELDVEARRRGGRVARTLVGSQLLDEVPDLVEYPAVVSGAFAEEFLTLPDEVLTTTMIHHQHFFPVVNDQAQLLPVFLAVLNMQPEKPEVVARNLERVLTARLRDARFFYEADRREGLEARLPRLGTVLFHKKLGSYQDKAGRVAALARWIAADVLGESAAVAAHAERAGRLCKADLASDMVRELTELQGTMGGIYAREDGEPEEVWRAIAHHYLPLGVEADAPPGPADLGPAACTWAAVSMADKLDTLAGMFAAGERPTGSRDPYGLRRAAQGLVRILVDLPELTGLELRLTLGPLVARAAAAFPSSDEASLASLWAFLGDRIQHTLEQRGNDVRNVRAVTHGPTAAVSPLVARRKLDVLPAMAGSAEFTALAGLFKRVRNIAKHLDDAAFAAAEAAGPALGTVLVEPAELALLAELDARGPVIARAVAEGAGFAAAFAEAARFAPAVATFFDDVLVMADEPAVKTARLRLMRRLEALILSLADVSEIVAEEK
ncbi:MAG: glycine--tRNA ligase subunit beta [Vicinamibacterales bacterium]|nr:glycine--tRNA ligase subunit beta [Vicinamibacterales bacterium]